MIQTNAHIIHQATQLQQQAGDPAQSVWVAANAGTGKTYVLIQRLIRLLLADPELPPQKILALTFSRAAATEMATRLSQKVGTWPNLTPDELTAELTAILGRAPTSQELQFAQALPERLSHQSISAMTLHKFCQQVLQRFPLEAGISPQFTLWEETAMREELTLAQTQALTALTNPEHAAHWAFAFLTRTAGQHKLTTALGDYINNRTKLAPLVQDETFDARLRHALKLPDDVTDASILAALDASPAINMALLNQLKTHETAFLQCSIKPQQYWAEVAAVLHLQALDAPQDVTYAQWRLMFFTKKDAVRKLDSAITKKLREQIGEDILTDLVAEQQKLVAHEASLATQKTYLATKAFFAIGAVMENAYRARKEAAAALDFDDLIHKTHRLLQRSDLQDWVRYRLDGGVQHILLDETQDTNQQQWEVVAALMAEFFNGSEQIAPRTLFAVGDFKQSIYRFQGAESGVFRQIQTTLEAAQNNGYQAATDIEMNTSFRSVPAVLQAVDATFNQAGLKNLTAAGQAIKHATVRQDEPGSVILWPPIVTEKAEKPAPWTRPIDKPTPVTAKALLGEKIAAEIRDIITGKNPQHSITRRAEDGTLTPRAATLADILLLVRSRTALPELTAALSQNGFRYTTLDRPETNLHHPIAQDILALLTLLMQPRDDVALASVLRSPLYQYSNTQLQSLLTARADGQPLWEVLPEDIQTQLTHCAKLAQNQPTTALHVLLHELNIVAVLAANIGQDDFALAESQAIFNGFLAAADVHKHLVDFISAIQTHGVQILRPETTNHNALRIMTVHGAKGLEAPIVFMVDGQKNLYQSGGESPVLAWDNNLCLFRLSTAHRTDLQEQLDIAEQQQTLADELRLLYVAMTRAAQRLYICAAGKNTAEKLMEPNKFDVPNNWWGIVANAAEANNWEQPDGRGYQSITPLPAGVEMTPPPIIQAPAQAPAPAWLFKTYDAPLPAPTPQSAEQQRGELLHQALAAYCDYGQESGLALLDTPEDKALIEQVFTTHPWLLGSTAKRGQCEVPFIYDNSKRIIDRLLIDDAARKITIVDYKSDATPPANIPPAYQNQLRTYRTIIAAQYRGYTIDAGILWLITQTWQVLDV